MAFNLGEWVRLGRSHERRIFKSYAHANDLYGLLPFALSTFWLIRPIKIAEIPLIGVFKFVEPVLPMDCGTDKRLFLAVKLIYFEITSLLVTDLTPSIDSVNLIALSLLT